ncbi:hypothetical protein A0H76_1 [Hepatospora eriocheir]|uniref:Uncharacterized protein n=1 Tax=Hepatospora eriocheir TaxID=1081669 RepID=A0A1X0QLH7_9MICR|nr:hypothetical protein A0H76_1 [Hepatospora eriocheir]
MLIKKYSVDKQHFYRITTYSSFIQIDYPCILSGDNFRTPAIHDPPAKLKFLIYEDYSLIDELYLSKPTLGVLFLNKKIKIYCTRAVYKQILLKYEEYKNMIVSYDFIEKNKCTYKTLDDANIDLFEKCVVIISFNQRIYNNNIMFESIPAGTNLGWCNYLIHLPDNKSIFYVGSFKNGNRFAKPGNFVKSDYFILNTHYYDDIRHYQNIESFNLIISNHKSSKCVIVIPIDFTRSFVDIIFHILYLVEKKLVPIYIYSKIFNSLELNLNIQGELVSPTMLENANTMNDDVFCVKKYKYLELIDDLSCLDNNQPKIVFVNELTQIEPNDYLRVFKVEKTKNFVTYKNCEYFDLNLEEHNFDDLVDKEKLLFSDSDTVFIEYENNIDLLIQPHLICNDLELYINGKLSYTDKNSKNVVVGEIELTDHFIQKLFLDENPIILNNNTYVFTKNKIKLTIIDHSKHKIEYL